MTTCRQATRHEAPNLIELTDWCRSLPPGKKHTPDRASHRRVLIFWCGVCRTFCWWCTWRTWYEHTWPWQTSWARPRFRSCRGARGNRQHNIVPAGSQGMCALYRELASHVKEKTCKTKPTLLTTIDRTRQQQLWNNSLHFKRYSHFFRASTSLKILMAGYTVAVGHACMPWLTVGAFVHPFRAHQGTSRNQLAEFCSPPLFKIFPAFCFLQHLPQDRGV